MQKTTCRGASWERRTSPKELAVNPRASNCSLTAVASRDPERSRQFIAECQRFVRFDPPPPLGSYEELLAADDVDAVYIPLPTGIRKPWAIRAAEAGKHVLVEKPVGATSQDVRDILAACRRRCGVQFMDGVMFMHSRRMEQIREILADGQSIGALKRITSQFSFGVSSESFARNVRPQPARAAGMSRRLGLVHDPLHSLRDELAVARAGCRPFCSPKIAVPTARRRSQRISPPRSSSLAAFLPRSIAPSWRRSSNG